MGGLDPLGIFHGIGKGYVVFRAQISPNVWFEPSGIAVNLFLHTNVSDIDEYLLEVFIKRYHVF